MPKLDRKAVIQQWNTARLTAAATLKSIRTSIEIYHSNGTLSDELRRKIEKILYEVETSTRDDLNETSKLIEGGVEPLEICKTKVELLKTSFQSKILMVQAQLKTVVSRKETSEESAKKMVEWTTSYSAVAIDPAGRRLASRETYEEIEREREAEKVFRAMHTTGFPLREFETKRIATRTITTKRGSLTFKFDPIGGEREPGGALDQLREFFLNEQAIMEEQEYVSPTGESKTALGCKFCGCFVGVVLSEDGAPIVMSHSADCWWDLSKQAFKFLFE
jgi:hypothetical protein